MVLTYSTRLEELAYGRDINSLRAASDFAISVTPETPEDEVVARLQEAAAAVGGEGVYFTVPGPTQKHADHFFFKPGDAESRVRSVDFPEVD